MSDGTNQKSAMAEIVKAMKEPGATNAEVVIPAAKEVVLPAAKQIGKGLEDLFFIFFSPLSNKRMKIEAKQKDFIEEVESRVSQIDPEKLTEPSLSVTGRAIDEAKFHVEDDEIRSMFAKLIAASVNTDYKDATLPAFVEVLKQLSPFDAKNLIELHEISKIKHSSSQVAGLIRLFANKNSNSGRDLFQNFIPFKNMNGNNHQVYAASIDNLLRLGLITITHNYSFDDKTFYKNFDTHPLYTSCTDFLNKRKSKGLELESSYVKIVYATWNFTNFGNFFIQCCLEEAQ